MRTPGDTLLEVIGFESDKRDKLIEWINSPQEDLPPATARRGALTLFRSRAPRYLGDCNRADQTRGEAPRIDLFSWPAITPRHGRLLTHDIHQQLTYPGSLYRFRDKLRLCIVNHMANLRKQPENAVRYFFMEAGGLAFDIHDTILGVYQLPSDYPYPQPLAIAL
jgi:hypothetical protein